MMLSYCSNMSLRYVGRQNVWIPNKHIYTLFMTRLYPYVISTVLSRFFCVCRVQVKCYDCISQCEIRQIEKDQAVTPKLPHFLLDLFSSKSQVAFCFGGPRKLCHPMTPCLIFKSIQFCLLEDKLTRVGLLLSHLL